jgi:hypothetical protein
VITWEYKVVDVSICTTANQGVFNDLGRDEWELIGVSDGLAFFKRPLLEQAGVEMAVALLDHMSKGDPKS